MDDWAKALVSAGFGLVAGLLAEPIRFWLSARAKTRSARAALYSDMGRVYHVLSRTFDVSKGAGGFEDTPVAEQERVTEWLRASKLDVFTFYSTEERAVFFSIPEYQAIAELYESLARALETLDRSWAERYAAIAAVFQTFERLFNHGALDSALLLKLRAEHREKTVTQIARFHTLRSKGEAVPVRDSKYAGESRPASVFNPKDSRPDR